MRKVVYTNKAPQAVGPYSQAIEIDNTLYVSGQIAINPGTGEVVSGGIREQTEQVMKNIFAILEEAGYASSDVVKSTCLLSDMDNFKDRFSLYY